MPKSSVISRPMALLVTGTALMLNTISVVPISFKRSITKWVTAVVSTLGACGLLFLIRLLPLTAQFLPLAPSAVAMPTLSVLSPVPMVALMAPVTLVGPSLSVPESVLTVVVRVATAVATLCMCPLTQYMCAQTLFSSLLPALLLLAWARTWQSVVALRRI